MANYATLKAAIAAAIKQNGNNEITGNLLQQQLLAMVNSLGVGYQYAGVAIPATNPGTPDQNVFYLASTAGTYTNFGSLVLADGEIAILKYNGTWSKDSTGAATQESVNQLGQEIKDSTGEIREVTLYDTSVNVFKVDIKQGNGFYWRITGTFTRVIINYNGSNNNRLIDSNQMPVVSGTWYYSVAPVDLTQLGFWYPNAGTAISFAIRMFDKSYLEAAPELYGVLNMMENTGVKKQSINLFDYSARSQNSLLISDGTIVDSTTYYTSEYIPVYKNKTYSFRGYIRRAALYDSYYRLVQYVETAGANYQFTPTKDGFLRFSAGNTLTDAILIEGSVTPQEYIPYKERIQENVYLSETLKAEILALSDGGELSLELSDGNNLNFKNGSNQINAILSAIGQSAYDANPVFDFVNYTYNGHTQTTDDDVAPLHIFGTTLGANHGQPCQKLTIASHGLTNADVGKYMTLSGTSEKYYIVRIVDSNNIWVLGENTSSDPSNPTFRTLSGSSASLTMNGATYNATAIASAQLRPIVKNVIHSIIDNNGNEIIADGSYTGQYFDIIESYDIMYIPSVLSNLIAGVGTTTDPVYDGDSAISVKNIYRFLPNLSVLVFATIIPRMNIKFADAMFTQAVRIGGLITTKYYLPGSVPGNTYDLTRPLAVPFGSSTPSIAVSKNNHWPDASTPVDRVLQFTTEHGLAIGIIPGIGVGKNIVGFTDQTFEIRGSSGKIYPHPVNYAVVGNLAVGKIYNAGMFRAFIPNDTMDSDVIGVYGYEYDGHYYLYADFANTAIKEIPVSHKYDGRNVEIVKSVNCQLLTDICNGGISISATAITGETSCIIVKI